MDYEDVRWMVSTVFSAMLGVVMGLVFAGRVGISKVEAQEEMLTAQQLQIVDPSGHRRILLGTSSEGSPNIWFFDENGKARLNLGLYGDGNSLVVLNDEHESAVGILRSVGSKNAPVLVMKSNGLDKIVEGLNFNGDMEPFLVRYDDQGIKKSEFGTY